MTATWRTTALAAVLTAFSGLSWTAPAAHAQGTRTQTSSYVTPNGGTITYYTAPANSVAANPWGNYATTRSAPWLAYTSQPSPWRGYVYTQNGGYGLSRGPSNSSGDLVPRYLAYGYKFNEANGHWEHPGYGGRIPDYARGGKPELPRPWLWWGANGY